MYIKDDAYASCKLLRLEFEKRGYIVTEEYFGRKLVFTYTSPSGKTWKTSASHIWYPFISEKLRSISINKEKAYGVVHSLGYFIPFTKFIPADYEIKNNEIDILLATYKKIIVKPANSSLSRGLTMNILTRDSLIEAINVARKRTSNILIQEQVEGEEIRFVVINGKVVSALLRRTPRVVGDGYSTVARLIELENNKRKILNFDYVTYPLLSEEIVKKEWISSNAILKKDELLELNRATMIKNGASVYDVLDQVDVSYINIVEDIVKNLNVKFLVVDIIFNDYTSKTNDKYWFVEFNTSPVLKLFYGCRDGKMFNIIPILVDNINEWIHSAKNQLT